MPEAVASRRGGIVCVLGRRAHVLEALDGSGFPLPPLKRTGRSRVTFARELPGQIASAIGSRRCEAVLTDAVETTPVAWAVAEILRAPLVVRVRGDAWAEVEQTGQKGFAMRAPGARLLLRAYGAALKDAARVVPVSAYLAGQLGARVGIDAGRMIVVPSSVAGERLRRQPRPDALRQLGQSRKRILLSVTNFRFPEKVRGLERAAASMRRVLEAHGDVLWVVAGGGPYLKTFRRIVTSELGRVADRLILTGFVTDIAPYYAACSAVVYYSHLDAFPRAILEAQAAGRVVVAGANGGIPELVEHGRTGLLCVPGDELVRAVSDVLDDERVEARIGAQAAAHIDACFSPETIGAKWRAVIEALPRRGRS